MLKESRRLKPGEMQLRFGSGDSLDAVAVGVCEISLPNGTLLLNECFFVPGCVANIISLFVLDTEGFCINIKNSSLYLYDKNNIQIICCPNKHGHYTLQTSKDILSSGINKRRLPEVNNTKLWHMRLGHIGVKRLNQLVRNGLIPDLTIESYPTCESCIQGKMTKAPFSGVGHRATNLLELVHSDVCGPLSQTAHSGYSYFVTFTDDLSRYGYVYLMRHKSETFEKFKEFRNEVEKQTGKYINCL